MCAQVDYRDEDLQEALVNVTSGMCFAVRPSAAQAAGFVMTDLLNRSYREDQKGQAVVEMPDCKDLVLAPDYNLEKRLEAQRSKAAQGQAQRFAERPTEPLRVMREQMAFRTQVSGHSSPSFSSSFLPGGGCPLSEKSKLRMKT